MAVMRLNAGRQSPNLKRTRGKGGGEEVVVVGCGTEFTDFGSGLVFAEIGRY